MEAIPCSSRAAGLACLPARPAAVQLQRRRSSLRSRQGRLVAVAAKGNPKPAPSAPAPDAATTVAPEWVTPPGPYHTQQQPYAAAPQYSAPPPQAQPMQAAPAQSGGLPWYVWVGVGILVTNVAAKAMSMANPQKLQQMAAEQMMKQMMNQAMKAQGGGAAPGGSPFGFPPPGGYPGAGPFGGATPGANPFAPGANPFANMTPPVDVTAQPAPSSSPAAAAAPSSSSAAQAAAPVDVSSSPSPPSSTAQQSSFFRDVDADDGKGPTVEVLGSNGAAASTPSSSWTPPAANFFEQQAGAGAAEDAQAEEPQSEERAKQYLSSMEVMLKNPEMQKMLYPYLPEPMRNPETFEWMLNDPTTRAQLEQTLAKANLNFDPNAMQSMLQNVPSPDSPEFKQQFEQLGMKPEEMMQKLLSDPELMSSFQNPKVQKAVMELSTNPMAIMNYQNDPEVMKVLMKLQEMMAPAIAKMEAQQQGQ